MWKMGTAAGLHRVYRVQAMHSATIQRVVEAWQTNRSAVCKMEVDACRCAQ